MKTINNFLLAISFTFLFFSCDDILEDDITNDTILIIYPQSNQEIAGNIVNFQWQALDGADKYRVQVYNSNQSIALDSLVSTTFLNYSLNPGSYQWRVRGENSAYTSSYSFASNFSVIETNDLANYQVVLLNPSTDFVTNNPSLIFTWQAINVANSYSFELINVSAGNNLIHQVSGLTTNTISLNASIINTDAVYQWRVKAVNSSSETQFTNRGFSLDRVNPNQPINSAPVNDYSQQSSATPISFNWSIPPDTGLVQSNINYTIEFSNALNFSPLLQTSSVETTAFSQVFQTPGIYYWRVIARDAAGNISVASTPFKFIIE
jgi:hypothetical protein